ncbi:MAG: hypothetical protein KJO31_06270 [Gammaproteobacteria bacterium]|nr:hypothetical protein [Gammaproteobacteria bacterium]
MQHETNTAIARDIMLGFADRTGLTSTDNAPRRYLWTDAHAVCNFLSLYRNTSNERYRRLALDLIDQVHHVLGKHRGDDARHGWISGLSDEEGEKHPTAGGLRIGKTLNERRADEAYDERLEWDRDGQYFHYLTKWMHALYRASVVLEQPRFHRWAIELAKAAHAGFVRAPLPDGRKRLVWKMSIDLSYPLVPSSGLHDPLDGYITCNELAFSSPGTADLSELPSLGTEIRELHAMLEDQRWATDDPLGIGGLLFDACRSFQLIAAGHTGMLGIARTLTRDIQNSLPAFAGQFALGYPAGHRLAFRELGLSIGLHGVERMQRIAAAELQLVEKSLRKALDQLETHVALGMAIETFWSDPANQRGATWSDHQDINSVMLATSLLPDEFLSIFDG